MKKFGMILGILAMLAFIAVPAMAIMPSDGDSGSAVGAGGFLIGAEAGSMIGDSAHQGIPNGGACGLSGAIGGAKAGAIGGVVNGTVEGDVTATGGGLTETHTNRFTVPHTDKSIGVGSYSQSEGVTGATAYIKVDPARGWHTGGLVGAHIGGFAAEGTLNVSHVGPSTLTGWESTGHTGGIAAQGAVGGFEGDAGAYAGSDYGYCHPVNSRADARMGANIDMWGNSYSESYRYINNDGAFHTEGMGTNVGAYTNVESSGYAGHRSEGFLSGSDANVCGGWLAAGGAASRTVQGAPDGGGARAVAVGGYVGAGTLNTNFTGSAVGYTATSVTTVAGMNGSINSSAAGMTVTSSVTGNMPR